jgi:hypothetical protein
MMLVRVGGKYVHLLKMLGALFTFACAFNVLAAAYTLSQTIDTAIHTYPADVGSVFGASMAPIGAVFLWLALMVFGLTLYRADRTFLPIEEDISESGGTVEKTEPKTKAKSSKSKSKKKTKKKKKK